MHSCKFRIKSLNYIEMRASFWKPPSCTAILNTVDTVAQQCFMFMARDIRCMPYTLLLIRRSQTALSSSSYLAVVHVYFHHFFSLCLCPPLLLSRPHFYLVLFLFTSSFISSTEVGALTHEKVYKYAYLVSILLQILTHRLSTMSQLNKYSTWF